MRAVDTNVILRLITGDGARQTATAEAFVEKGAWVQFWRLQKPLGSFHPITNVTRPALPPLSKCC